MLKEKWTQWIPIIIIVCLLIIFNKTVDSFADIKLFIGNFIRIISPFLYGILIVYFLYVPCKRIEELYLKSNTKWVKKKARLLSVISVFVAVILVSSLLITFLVPILIASIIDLGSNVPAYFNNIVNYIERVTNNPNIANSINDFANTTINDLFNADRLQDFTRSIIGFATGIFNVFISLVASLYILLERDKIKEFFERLSKVLFKDKVRHRLNNYLREINKVLFTFIASKGLDSIINMVVVTSILLIFDVEYAFLLGFIAGILNFIPYLGTLIAVIFISIITLLTGGLSLAITVLIFLLIFQQLDANVIEPRIMRSTLKISPLLVIFSVIVGGAYFGIIGMFLAVPIATIIKYILLEYMDSREEKKEKKAT